MKSHIKVINIPHHSEEWFEFRKNGIGGSEAATVLGINKYDTAARLFHEKIGTIDHRKDDNERMLFGRVLEEQIANIWRYFDGSKDGYVENYNNNRIIRECRNLNGYAVNPNYPWLFGSVDRLINIKGGFNLITGEPLSTEAILECKNLSYWSAQQWEDGIPIYFLVQVHVYMIIFETDYAEIAMLVDGGNFVVEKVMRDDQLVERILSITKDFWYKRILPAKEALKNRSEHELIGNIVEIERCESIIQRLEPESDDSDAYAEFMEERFVKEREQTIGTLAQLKVAKDYRFLMSLRTHLDKVMQGIKNKFIKDFTDKDTESFDFGSLGYVNWSLRKGTKNRTFNNKLKEKPTDEQVEEQFNKLDLEY